MGGKPSKGTPADKRLQSNTGKQRTVSIPPKQAKPKGSK